MALSVNISVLINSSILCLDVKNTLWNVSWKNRDIWLNNPKPCRKLIFQEMEKQILKLFSSQVDAENSLVFNSVKELLPRKATYLIKSRTMLPFWPSFPLATPWQAPKSRYKIQAQIHSPGTDSLWLLDEQQHFSCTGTPNTRPQVSEHYEKVQNEPAQLTDVPPCSRLRA